MKTQPAKARILIVDDHPMVREGLATRIGLHHDLEVCGEAESEDEALKMAAQTDPDLIIVDIALKSGHGLDLIKQVKSQNPSAKMLVLSGFQESLYAERALRAGAQGYLNKQESSSQVIEAIRTVLKGEQFIGEEIRQRLVNQALGRSNPVRSIAEQLTDRELEVFVMIGDGISTGVIAERLFLSPHTVETHRENIKRKLGLRKGAELTRAAVKWNLENRAFG